MKTNIKRFLALALAVFMIVGMMPMNVFATETETEDTATTSWYDETATELVIDSVADLQEFATLTQGGNTFSGKTVKLGTDIDLAGTYWYHRDAEGTVQADYRIVDFAGTFDGNG
ncbi:MAG: hypothetical protein IJX04_08615 [Oscillospiraceae bacterium]|nr:hypothetical protein [Oscillospiraceae bacterium]